MRRYGAAGLWLVAALFLVARRFHRSDQRRQAPHADRPREAPPSTAAAVAPDDVPAAPVTADPLLGHRSKTTPVVVTTAVLGGALYLDVLQDWLLERTAFGPAVLVVIVAAGWIVPAAAVVQRQQRHEPLAAWLIWVPRLALFALLLLLHLVDFPTFERDGLLAPWVYGCLAVAFIWSLIYRIWLPGNPSGMRAGLTQGAHFFLDMMAALVALMVSGPFVLGAAYGMGEAPGVENAAWYAAIVASGLLGTLAMSLATPWLQHLPRRLAVVALGYVQLVVVLYAPQDLLAPTHWVVLGTVSTAAVVTLTVSGLRARKADLKTTPTETS